MNGRQNWYRLGVIVGVGAFLSGAAGFTKADAQELLPAGATVGKALPSQPESVGRKLPRPTAKSTNLVSRTISANESRQWAGVSDTLMLQSRSAFERGLMSLPDYATQLAVATRIKTTLASRQNDESAGIVAQQQRIQLLRRAAAQLVRFRQPAAKGWASDVALARLLVADAQVDLATAGDNEAALTLANGQRQLLAQRHLHSRMADYEVGLASLPQLARAARYFVAPRPDGRLPADRSPAAERDAAGYRERLQAIVSRTAELNRRGAGVGRVDHLLRAQAELQAAMLLLAPNDDDTARDTAISTVADAFDVQLRYQRTGTSSLFDVADQWWYRRTLRDPGAVESPDETSLEQNRLQRDLGTLVGLASDTRDMRGRAAADVSFVRALSVMEQLDQRDALPAPATNDTPSSPGDTLIPSTDPTTPVP